MAITADLQTKKSVPIGGDAFRNDRSPRAEARQKNVGPLYTQALKRLVGLQHANIHGQNNRHRKNVFYEETRDRDCTLLYDLLQTRAVSFFPPALQGTQNIAR